MTFSPLDNSKQSTLKKDEKFLGVAETCLNEIFKPEVAEKIRPLFLKNRTLTLSCANSEIAGEVREKQDKIVIKMNEKLGTKEVDRVRYLL